MQWMYNVNIAKFDLAGKEHDEDAVRKTLSELADYLNQQRCFSRFNAKQLRNIPESDDYFSFEDYVIRALEKMYDYADDNRIWLEQFETPKEAENGKKLARRTPRMARPSR